ncbi:MAG: sulfotransferase family 2 domain-containing protein [Pseudomonadota bacterium]
MWRVMLVSHRHRFIYLKTRKSASSSVELAFEHCARPVGWKQPEDNAFATEEMVSDAGIVGARGLKAKQTAEFTDHIRGIRVKKLIGREIWNSYFKFCTIRNPWEKTVSHFHFTHPNIRNARERRIVRVFREWLRNNDSRHGVDKGIYWIDGKPVMDYYIRHHNIVEDVTTVADHLGVKLDPLGEVFGQFRKSGLSYTEYYDDQARSLVANFYEDEIKWFGWSFENDQEIELPPLEKRSMIETAEQS